MKAISIRTAAFACVTLSPATPASAATVSPVGVRFAHMAVNADGATVVAWERPRRDGFSADARIGSAPTRLGATRRLSRGSGYLPRVAIGADATAAVMWVERGARGINSMLVAVARPGRPLGRRQVVDRRRSSMTPAGVAVAPSGRVVALWRRSAGSFAFALARSRHAFGAARRLDGAKRQGLLVLDPRDGTAVVAHGTTAGQVAVRALAPAAGAFSAATILAGSQTWMRGFDGGADVFAVSGPAGVGLTYTLADRRTLVLARRAADGSFTTGERIATVDYGETVFAQGLRATLPADGAAVATWLVEGNVPGGGVRSEVVTSVTGPSGAFGAPQALTPATTPGSAGYPAAAAAGGEAFVATAAPGGPVLLAIRAAGAEGFAPPATLASRADGDVQLAAAGNRVLVAYQQRERVQLKIVR